MTRFGLLVAARLGEAAAVLLAALLVTFLLLAAAPGDAATSIAQTRFGVKVTASKVEQVRRELGLDGSLLERYARQASGWLRGDLGTSVRTKQPVASEIGERLAATIQLATVAALITLVGGVGGGALAVLARRRLARAGIRAVALLALSIPSFALAYLLVFVFSLRLGWLPTGPAERRHRARADVVADVRTTCAHRSARTPLRACDRGADAARRTGAADPGPTHHARGVCAR